MAEYIVDVLDDLADFLNRIVGLIGFIQDAFLLPEEPSEES